MKRSTTLLILFACLCAGAISGDTLIESSAATPAALSAQSAFEKSEAAYRANNLGVALLEQYQAKEAADSFTRALEIKPELTIARINLGISLYYLPDTEGAKRETQKALGEDPNRPQSHYILGLIARAQNRFDEAISEFQSVLKIDPDDVGSNINLGQIFSQEKKYVEAIGAFRRAVAAEPYNQTALYNLGLLLTRTGKREEGQQLIKKFQQFQASGAGTTIGTNYLEGGHYAEAVVSTGIEPELVDHHIPEVTFDDATEQFLPSQKAHPHPKPGSVVAPFALMRPAEFNDQKKQELVRALASSVTLIDVDGDGFTDLLDLGGEAPRLYRNAGGKFVDESSACGALCAAHNGILVGAVAGDFDNDGKPDVLLLSYGPHTLSLYHNDGRWHFSDVTKSAGIPSYSYLTLSAAFVDVDHDGDLDIFVAGLADMSVAPRVRTDLANMNGFISFPLSFTGAPNLLLRNNGNGSFTDITNQSGVRGSLGHAMAVVPTDYDNHRDIDLLVVNFGTPPMLYSNQRDGTFRDVAHETGLAADGKRAIRSGNWDFIAATAGDFNKDGFTDFFFLDSLFSGVFVTSDGKGGFQIEDKTPWYFQVGGGENIGAQFIDYDNDGLLDLVRVMGDGVHVWRNEGDKWLKITNPHQPEIGINAAPLFRVNVTGSRAFAAGDLDGDGNIDLVMRGSDGRVVIAKNEARNRNKSIRVNVLGHVSNRSALGAKIEMRAGSLYQKLETYSASPAPAPADLIFGLGKRDKPDALRVLWPAGIVQAETDIPAAAPSHLGFLSLNLTELDRKPSSCPYLYTWNGERFEFITDFMGGGEMGYLEEPGRYNQPDPDEYVRIRSDQLKEKDGRYELRVTNELEESMFVDRLQLIAVAHPEGTEVYPNEGMSDPPKPFKLFVTHNARPPLSAIDDHGNDVLDLISKMDRRWPGDFKLDRIRGYADEHTLTMKLADGPENRVVLLMTGWTDYAWSSDNVAASQAKKEMTLPSLQVKDANGKWRTVIEDIGIPVGRPQTVTVDLTGKFLSADREVRLVTNMRIYWDQILVDTSDGKAPVQINRLDPARADLRWRGFSAEVTPDGREPFGYDYRRVSFTSPWKVMTGRYTREGDVRELLLRSDDMFVVSRPGDEISLSFDAKALPPLPAGWTRTFLLYADGFSKEMDINSASPDQLAPLPFHGMSRYPYPATEHYPLTDERRRYLEKYNTRIVTSAVPSIGTLLIR
jgi:tetratricopeptide (TPR) repeat protein